MTAAAARARTTDPGTSHDAASSVSGLTEKRRSVLAVLEEHGPMTDEELVAYYGRSLLRPPQSDSGIRTRRHELVELGYVVEHSTKRLRSGRRAIVWRVRSPHYARRDT